MPGRRDDSKEPEFERLKAHLFGGKLKARNFRIFPGTNPRTTPEEIARAVNRFFDGTEAGRAQIGIIDH